MIAKETLLKYYNRGGRGLGDIPQHLEGSNLINTIGYSLSLVPNIKIVKWSSEQLQLAKDGNIDYYKGKNLRPIKRITTKIIADCNGSKKVILTILPISFFDSGSLITLPLFRYRIDPDVEIEKLMDHTGRVYMDFEDWLKNNTLPAVKLLYPRDGKLVNLNEDVDCVVERSAKLQLPVKPWVSDVASGALGLAGIGTTVLTGGLALPTL